MITKLANFLRASYGMRKVRVPVDSPWGKEIEKRNREARRYVQSFISTMRAAISDVKREDYTHMRMYFRHVDKANKLHMPVDPAYNVDHLLHHENPRYKKQELLKRFTEALQGAQEFARRT